MDTTTGTARKVHKAEAHAHFLDGGEVLVSTYDRDELNVTSLTVTHTAETTTWAELCEQVRMWANRYPGQRFYIVERAA